MAPWARWRHVGAASVLVQAGLSIVAALSGAERGYCRLVHLVLKPGGLVILGTILFAYESRRWAAWTGRERVAYLAILAALLVVHGLSFFVLGPATCGEAGCTGPFTCAAITLARGRAWLGW